MAYKVDNSTEIQGRLDQSLHFVPSYTCISFISRFTFILNRLRARIS